MSRTYRRTWIALGLVAAGLTGAGPPLERPDLQVTQTDSALGTAEPATEGPPGLLLAQFPAGQGARDGFPFWFGFSRAWLWGPTEVHTLPPQQPPPLLWSIPTPAGVFTWDMTPPMRPNLRPLGRAARPLRPANPKRFTLMMTYGDRLFRVGNLTRATERYEQAGQADSSSAEPQIRLGQIALKHGDYAGAADRLREALTIDPDYLANASTIRVLYPEPADFAKLIATIEGHLQAHPDDRDAWLVLGAEKFLAGRTQEAGDCFLRLTDRRPDATLAAFLAASNLKVPEFD
ncbi:MAG: tetratricopeptide repeat protein [Isosphaeraceae bacterium]